MCFARTVTQRIRYAARTAKKSGSKAAHGCDKPEQGGTLPPLAECQASGLCLRVPTATRAEKNARGGLLPSRKTTLATRGSCGVLLVASPPSCLQRRKPRVAGDVSAPSTFPRGFCGALDFWERVCARLPGRHIRAAVVAARSSYPRATLCADALVYRLQLQTPCVAKSSSAGDSSLANKGSPRATPRADPL